MANWRLLTDFTKKAEGGNSADPNDNALQGGHSGILGGNYDRRYPNNYIHTNKGVIWQTWVAYNKIKGKTPSPQEFVTMTNAVWEDIFKTLFWNRISGDLINSQGIAEILMEAIWGGGSMGMVKTLQKFLNDKGASPVLKVDGAMGSNTAKALNKYTTTKAKEREVVDLLINQRLNYLKSLNDWVHYGKAWGGRVSEVASRAYEYIAKRAASNKGKALIGALILGGLAYYYSDKISAFFKKGIKVLK
jgi:lysozyme family protein